ncbi:helix-turn-helix domain-containing protein [Deinococcus ficus]|uniref:helix-turn-helix domain-containing protein n=1 Tax=Deinococcus ficus TaxID=317577 RepID=UPI00174E9E4E|nr:helix-turn-helix domain-containing protein [Deinococcus ficus]GHF75181.1 hypothetical protein GCM10017782_10970 [Deinococcus ficus]
MKTVSPTNKTVPQDALLLTVKQAAILLQIGKNRVYEMVETREMPSMRIGQKILIPRVALEQWVVERLALEIALAA